MIITYALNALFGLIARANIYLVSELCPVSLELYETMINYSNAPSYGYQPLSYEVRIRLEP